FGRTTCAFWLQARGTPQLSGSRLSFAARSQENQRQKERPNTSDFCFLLSAFCLLLSAFQAGGGTRSRVPLNVMLRPAFRRAALRCEMKSSFASASVDGT